MNILLFLPSICSSEALRSRLSLSAMAGGNAGAAAAAASRLVFSFVGLLVPLLVAGDDPYRFFTWTVTYGDIYPLGVKQQVR